MNVEHILAECAAHIKTFEKNLKRNKIMVFTKEEYETFYKVRSNIVKRTEEIFHLLSCSHLRLGEFYESCEVDGDLEFRVGGYYLGEYDYTTYQRPLEYLFMTDEEIVKAEEEYEKKLKEAKELEEKERQQRIQESEIAQLKELQKKYSSI